MKPVRKGLAVLLAVLLILPGSSVSVERTLVAEAAAADVGAGAVEPGDAGSETEAAEPEPEDSVNIDGLAAEEADGNEDGEALPGTAGDEGSDEKTDATSNAGTDSGSGENVEEAGDAADDGSGDEVTGNPSVAEDEEGNLEMPDDALEDLEEMPVDGSVEGEKPEDENEVQSDGETLQTDGSSSEEDGLDVETESGQPLAEDLPVVYAENIVASGADGNLTWTLDSDGLLTISGTGDFSRDQNGNFNLWGDYRNSITSAKVDVTGMTDASYMFNSCYDLASVDLSGFDTSNVTDMRLMFGECYSLTSVDLSGFDTSNVTDMGFMFGECRSLTSLDLSSFDTSNVTRMDLMFSGCRSLASLDLSSFDTSNVTRMDAMFSDCSSLTDLDLSSFDTGNVTTMEGMFYGCNSLINLDLNSFDTGNVITMNAMFNNCTGLTNVDVSGFDTSSVTVMSAMFHNCSSLTDLDLSSFETSNVTDMQFMFSGGSSLTSLDLSSFDTSNVTNMREMFSGCRGLASLNLSSFDTSNVGTMWYMFYGCSSLMSLDLSSFDTGNATDMRSMFTGCSSLTSLDLSNFDIRNADIGGEMFSGCSSLESLDLSSFDTSNVTNMYSMFSGCSSLINLDLSSFDTSNVTSMYYMFSGCSSLKSLDLGNFDTSNVTSMNSMFYGCSSLTSLDLSSFDTSNLSGVQGHTFFDCSSLETLRTPKSVGLTITFSLPAVYSDSAGNLTQELTESYANMVLTKKGTEFGYVDGTNDMVCWIYDADTKTTTITGRGRRTVSADYQQSSLPMDTEYVIFVDCEIEGSLGSLFADLANLKSIDFTNLTVTNPTDYNAMFLGCSSLTELDLSCLLTDNEVSMSRTFHGCTGLTELDLTGFAVNDVFGMFYGCSGLSKLDLSNMKARNLDNAYSMFFGCSKLTELDLSGLDTSNVTNMRYMFSGCSGLTGLDLSGLDIGNVMYVEGMFSGCSSLTSLDLSSFDTGNVTNMTQMFWECRNLQSLNLASFDTGKVTSMNSMFYDCSKLTDLDLSSFDTSHVTDMTQMFRQCKSLQSLDLKNFDVNNVVSMAYMFADCHSLKDLDLGSFSTSKVTNMDSMFRSCSSLQSLDLSSFNTGNVTDMFAMFLDCSSLTKLDLSSFDTDKVTNMVAIFGYCGQLTSLDLSSFDMRNVTEAENMLNGCSELITIQAPLNLRQPVALPDVANTSWILSDKTEIAQLPQNLSESVLIKRYDTGSATEPTEPDGFGFWFQVTGAVGYSRYSEVYIAQNTSQNILDTLFDPLYMDRYQTLFINDSDTDLANLIPTFEGDCWILGPGGQLISGQTVQDFSKGGITYLPYFHIPSGGHPIVDWVYTVTFAKKESGPKLFVNGPAEREIFLTDYFQNQHDILIANVGDAQLTGIKAELLDAVNVKLDDSRPVESSLAAFGKVPGQGQEASDVMSNLGKVRLVPDGEGEISGTLKITADGQEPVYIVLTGYSSNPKITTTTTEMNMDDVIRVKYVPYSYTVETNNEYEWNRVTFSIESGELARGLQMYPATGEIYGVPLEAGEFQITVKATFSRPEFLPSYAQLTLIVKDNTDGNVNVATDPGYDLVQQVQDIVLGTLSGGSQTMVSLGDYAEFRAVYLDGEKLIEGEDYYSEAGSTRVTVQTQTLTGKGAGTHTLGIEFRTQENKMKRAAQNYTVAQTGDDAADDGSGNGGDNGGSPSGGDAGPDDGLYDVDVEVSETVIYTVRPGDSLWSIAFRFYGTGTLWRRIYADNAAAIRDPNRIYVGQKLVIRLMSLDSAGPGFGGAKGTIYSVMFGENLWTIAKKFYGNGMLWEKIYQANRELIFDPRGIYPGQRIVIPAE
jgi:surface protein